MNPEYERDGGEQEPIVPSAEVVIRINADCSDNQSPDKIAFGGEAHAPNVSPPGFIPDWREVSRRSLLEGTDRGTFTLP
jgi:hypothetical protein